MIDTPRIWSFGPAQLDERDMQLVVAGRTCNLERRSKEVLIHLLEHAGEVVTKDELLDAVWSDRPPSEATLAKCISRIRKALGNDARDVIQTAHGYGYRLVGDVFVAENTANPAQPLRFEAGVPVPHRAGWHLVRQLGKGSSGEAWLAKHTEDRQHRVIKFANDLGSLATLKREISLSRILAGSAGPTEAFCPILGWNLESAPYFMECEYIPDGNLQEWIDKQGGFACVSQELRLNLMLQLSESLALAHAAGVIHKDIKPGNVLIDSKNGEPRIRLCDFGSANLTARQREALGLGGQGFTQAGNIGARTAGTLMYMAPEALAGAPPNVQADIYALGVLLYQMLAGDLNRPLATGWESDISDPLLLQDIADATQGNVSRRMGTAKQFAERLRDLPKRHQAAQAEMQARQERVRAETMRRELSRLRATAIALVLMLCTATGAGILVTRAKQEAVQARDTAIQQEQRADRAASTTKAVSDFMNDELLGGMQWSEQSATISLKDMLDKVSTRVDERLGDHPDAAAEVFFVLGMRYGMNGYTEDAQKLWDRALTILVEEYGAGSIETVRALHLNGLIRAIAGQFDEAHALFSGAVTILSEQRGRGHLMTLYERSQVAEVDMYAGAPLQALAELQAIVQLAPLAPPLDDDDAELFAKFGEGAEGSSINAPLARKLATVAHEKLGFLYTQLRKVEDAEAHLLEAIRGYQTLYGTDTRSTLEASVNLVEVLSRQKRFDEAERLANDIEGQMSGSASPDNISGLMILHRRAILQLQKQDYKTAEALLRQAWAICPNALQEGCFYSESRNIPEVLAETLLKLERYEEAASILQNVLASRERQDGTDNLWTVPVRTLLAIAQANLGHRTEARQTLAPVPAILQARLPGDFPMRKDYIQTLELIQDGAVATKQSEPGFTVAQ